MNFLMPAVGGAIGGLVGAAIWAAIAHFAHREVGWVAWGVGGLVGLGVRVAAGDRDGPTFGVLAAVLAILSVLAGKYAGAALIASELNLDTSALVFTDEDMISSLADAVVKEKQAKGQKVAFPPGVTAETAGKQSDYPADVWTEASRRWKQLGPAAQQKQMADRKKEIGDLAREFQGVARKSIFESMFTPYDLLWFGLATFTAFRIGSGITSDD